MTNTNKPSLLRQLMGAAVGSIVALALYYSYKVATPLVTAYVTLPPAERQHDLGDVHVNADVSDEQRARMESRNQRLAESIQANQPQPSLTDIEPNDAWKDNWAPDVLEQTAEPIHTSAPEQSVVDEDDGWEDFLRDAAPAAKEETEKPPVVAQLHSGAPSLPDSGFGVVALMVSACGAALGVRKTRKK